MRCRRRLRPPAAARPSRPQLPTTAERWYRADLGADDESLVDDVDSIEHVAGSRGWTPLTFDGCYVDAWGNVRAAALTWQFTAAFGGAEFDDEEGLKPQKPTISFDGDWIVIEAGGNWGGCPKHTTGRFEWPWTAKGLAKLPEFLSTVEHVWEPMDPQPYIDCLAHGPCAELARERWTLTDLIDE